MKHLSYSAYIGSDSRKVEPSQIFQGEIKVLGKTIKGFITSQTIQNFDVIEGIKLNQGDKVELTFIWFSKETTISDYLFKLSADFNSESETYKGHCWKLPVKVNPDSAPEVTIKTLLNNVALKNPEKAMLILTRK